MKFSAAQVLLAVGLTSVSAQRDNYTIGSFSADCIPHSVNCQYAFTVLSDPSLPASNCNATLQGPDQLPNVIEGKCSDNVAYTWSITKTAPTGGDLDFKIWYAFNARSNITYCATIARSDITTENNGAVSTEHYTGPESFIASFLSC